ncbi:MAG: hypothetical protein A2252_06120 [Elusimicrobia bacterium RIFOXYA2_FULL_39_19]|nr:MAG: hypothetical protein A2252_06120 [Elusimicrobia bacterium RIFOXYA2_FULL_39_19]
MKKIFIFLLACLLFSVYSFAVNTGADFLKIAVGARAAGLGNTFTAVANDVTAINWNPGGLFQLKQKEISAMHTQWVGDSRFDFLGFALPLSGKAPSVSARRVKDIFGASIIYLSQGEMEGRDENRKNTGSFSASDIAVAFSYCRQVKVNGHQVGFGTNVKLINQKIESEQATGAAFDFGVLTNLPFKSNRLTLGLSLQNLGSQMKFISEEYNLPLSVTAGLGYSVGGVTIGLDIKQQVYENKTIVSLGTEFLPINALALRAGYVMSAGRQAAASDDGLPMGLGAGIGFRLFSYQTDYSFVPYGALGDTHRISFLSRF